MHPHIECMRFLVVIGIAALSAMIGGWLGLGLFAIVIGLLWLIGRWTENLYD